MSKCWSEIEPLAAPPRGNLRAGFSCRERSSGVALRTRYVRLLSGGYADLILPLPKCLVNRDSETDQVFLGEGISFVDRESLSWAKLGHPYRV